MSIMVAGAPQSSNESSQIIEARGLFRSLLSREQLAHLTPEFLTGNIQTVTARNTIDKKTANAYWQLLRSLALLPFARKVQQLEDGSLIVAFYQKDDLINPSCIGIYQWGSSASIAALPWQMNLNDLELHGMSYISTFINALQSIRSKTEATLLAIQETLPNTNSSISLGAPTNWNSPTIANTQGVVQWVVAAIPPQQQQSQIPSAPDSVRGADSRVESARGFLVAKSNVEA
jgi:hypothetical protein